LGRVLQLTPGPEVLAADLHGLQDTDLFLIRVNPWLIMPPAL
jgi:hypothetical protein